MSDYKTEVVVKATAPKKKATPKKAVVKKDPCDECKYDYGSKVCISCIIMRSK